MYIVMILSFRTYRPGQTVQTQIKLLLEEQSDQWSGSSQFSIPFASFFRYTQRFASLFEFKVDYSKNF